MGKTVPSYRMALEMEIDRWRGFRKALDDRGRDAYQIWRYRLDLDEGLLNKLGKTPKQTRKDVWKIPRKRN